MRFARWVGGVLIFFRHAQEKEQSFLVKILTIYIYACDDLHFFSITTMDQEKPKGGGRSEEG